MDKGDIAAPIPEMKGPGDPRKRYVRGDRAGSASALYQPRRSPRSNEGAVPIVLGGDHSLGAGSVAAAAAYADTKAASRSV